MSTRKAFIAGILSVIPATWVTAATVHVANNGVDSGTCGSFNAPCRSIGRGVNNARTGDTVLVRPGIYGDIDRDGVLGGPGEEVPTGRGTLQIAKPVKILSTAGAATTLIDGGSAAESVVEIASNDVTFGGVGGGFTILARQRDGILSDDRTNVRIVGNVVTGSSAVGVLANSVGIVEVSDNIVHDNPGTGISAGARVESSRVLVRRNKVYSNGIGIASGPFCSNEISFNEVSGNRSGIDVTFAPTLVFRNVVTANAAGISTASFGLGAPPSAGPTFVRNTIIGNRDWGITVGGGPVHATLRENNFYGNGAAPGFFANCAVANFSGVPLNAAGSYWGAAAGPGADPADATCGNFPVITTPFAKTPN